jgi:glycosyltransferase involved in cell wall biosynthesis
LHKSDKTAPQVSVVIPTFNSARLVREAIDSVLGQTYRDFEIIVVDDGSDDDTSSVVAQFGSNVNYFKQTNQGAGAARNQGIAMSRGKHIAFLDADDLWAPEKLAEQIPVIEQDSSVGLVYSDWAITSPGGGTKASQLKDLKPQSGNVFDGLVQCGFILTSGAVVRRTCLDDVGDFDNTLSIAQDYDLWLRISYRWKIELVNKVLVTKKDRDGNLSSNLIRTANERIALFHKALINFSDMTPSTRQLVKDQLAYNYWDVGYHHFDQLSLREARKSFASCLSYRPSNARAFGYFAATFLPSSVLKILRTAKRAVQ